jgi:hypothetical protein
MLAAWHVTRSMPTPSIRTARYRRMTWPPQAPVVDAPLTREQTMEAESFTDVQDEDDPEGYGFGV